MSEHGEGDGAFDAAGRRPSGRRLKPRIVYALLLGASLAGIWVSHWGANLSVRIVRWSVVVTAGALAGGLYWRLALFDADAFDDADSLEAVRRQWRRVETAAVWLLAACGLGGLGLGQWVSSGPGGLVVLLGSLLVPLLWFGIGAGRRRESASQNRTPRALLLAVSLAVLAGFAWLETGSGPVAWLVRFGHVGGFSLWLGGATWHNVVVLPTLRTRPSAAGALKGQARRFRRHLPVVVALILLTGLYQVTGLFGTSVAALVGTAIGLVVVAKVLVLATLTGFVVVGIRRGPG